MPNATPFPKDVTWSFNPSGDVTSFAAGALSGRIYVNSGHIEIAGPNLAGSALANLIRFAPPAVSTAQGTLTIGAVTSSSVLGNGVEVRQKLGESMIVARLTSPHEGVIRYEVTDWNGVGPLATAIASLSTGDEHFYGFGEKFDQLDQAGKVVRTLTFDDPGTKHDHSYKVSPWFISTRGYGLHLDSSAESTFDMRGTAHDHYVVTNLFSSLAFNVVYGPQLTDVLTRYTGYTGRPPLPPPWAFGPWISSDIWRSGGEVRYAVTQFRSRGLAASAFVFDSPWEVAYNDFKFNVAQFAKDATIDGEHFAGFASVHDLMSFLQTSGLKVICWMAPFVNVSSVAENVPGQNLGKAANYDDGASKGVFVRESAGGAPLVVPWWKGHGSPIDFTSATARQWLDEQLNALVALSRVTTAAGAEEAAIAGFKVDDGESGNGPNVYIPTTAHYSDGRTGIEMRNGYCLEYHKAVGQIVEGQGILFARSGFVGSHAFPGSWAGDNQPNFGDNGLPSVIVAGLTAAISGYAIWGHDTGGYQDTNFSISPPNLFMRWAQFGCFSPIMQMHRQVKKELQYPWRYGQAALDNFAFYAGLHTRLFPYIYTYAKQASVTGLPILRPLVLMNQTDPNTFTTSHTYLFGNELLVAPIIEPNAKERRVYLPSGTWIDFWTNARQTGKQTITWTNANQAQVPLFAREGAIIPMLLNEPQTLCDANYVNNPSISTPDSGLLLRIYPGGASSFQVHDGTTVTCETSGGHVTVSLKSEARAMLLEILTGAPQSVVRDGKLLPEFATTDELSAALQGWAHDTQTGLLSVKFQHTGGSTTVTT
jgi:alpha-D-xyloside xylohydrolase